MGDQWLLREDGVFDPTAVQVATEGWRPVRLTHRERTAAVAGMLLRGLSQREMMRRLSIVDFRKIRQYMTGCVPHELPA